MIHIQWDVLYKTTTLQQFVCITNRITGLNELKIAVCKWNTMKKPTALNRLKVKLNLEYNN